MKSPKFRNRFRIAIFPPSNVVVFSDHEYHALNGIPYVELAPLLTGDNSTETIIEKLTGRVDSTLVHEMLSRLTAKNFITWVDHVLPEPLAALADSFSVDDEAADRWAATTLALTSVGGVETDSLRSTLAGLGINVVQAERAAEATLELVITADYLHPDIAAIHQRARSAGRAWMLANPVSATLWIGPIFTHDKRACYECLSHRLRGQLPIEMMARNVNGGKLASISPVPAITTALANALIAREVAHWILAGSHPTLPGGILTFDCLTNISELHPVQRRPQCLVCGSFSYPTISDQMSPIMLESVPKLFTADGGHRPLAPEVILERLSPHLDRYTGVIREVRHLPVPDYPTVHSYNVAALLDPGASTIWAAFRMNLNATGSSGKGLMDKQAQASGICEAIERYSYVFQGYEAHFPATYRELEVRGAIHPNTVMQYSERQYRRREVVNLNSIRFSIIPAPFDEDQQISWSPVWSLTYQKTRFLPTAFCYVAVREPHEYTYADSNGCAAGQTCEDAILQGLMELVERDSVGIWWYNRLKRAAIDLSSFTNPDLGALIDDLRSKGMELWALDLTTDLGIPVVAACSRFGSLPVWFGFGSHLDIQIALSRAVTELCQILAGSVSPEYGGIGTAALNAEARQWVEMSMKEEQSYLFPDEQAPQRKMTDYPPLWGDDLRQDVEYCVELFRQHGMETLILDMTRPDIGLPVVRTIVPGLRHFWTRFAPGRLYDVPVKMGWLAEPTPEESLNPIPMFL